MARRAAALKKSTEPKKRGRPRKASLPVNPVTGATAVTDEVYKKHLGTIITLRKEHKKLQEDVREASGRYRNAVKLAKAEGCMADAITQALREADADPVELERLYHEKLRVHRLMDHPVGTQFSLGLDEAGAGANAKAVTGEGPMTPEVADRHGYIACRNKEPQSNNPHQAGTELHVAWKAGWDRAATESFDGTNAPRRGRGIGERAPSPVPTTAAAGNA